MRYEYSDSRPDPIPALKAQLGQVLAALLKGGNADDVAWDIGTDRPRVSELRRGKLKRFSLETLIRYLNRLKHRVDITVTHERPNYRRKLGAVTPRKPDAPSVATRETAETSTQRATTGRIKPCDE